MEPQATDVRPLMRGVILHPDSDTVSLASRGAPHRSQEVPTRGLCAPHHWHAILSKLSLTFYTVLATGAPSPLIVKTLEMGSG